MKLSVLTALLVTYPWFATGFASAQKQPISISDQITLSAEQEIKDRANFRLRGHVQIETASVIVYADEAEYDPLTGQLNPQGHVHVRFKSATPQLKISDSNPEDTPVIPAGAK